MQDAAPGRERSGAPAGCGGAARPRRDLGGARGQHRHGHVAHPPGPHPAQGRDRAMNPADVGGPAPAAGRRRGGRPPARAGDGPRPGARMGDSPTTTAGGRKDDHHRGRDDRDDAAASTASAPRRRPAAVPPTRRPSGPHYGPGCQPPAPRSGAAGPPRVSSASRRACAARSAGRRTSSPSGMWAPTCGPCGSPWPNGRSYDTAGGDARRHRPRRHRQRRLHRADPRPATVRMIRRDHASGGPGRPRGPRTRALSG